MKDKHSIGGGGVPYVQYAPIPAPIETRPDLRRKLVYDPFQLGGIPDPDLQPSTSLLKRLMVAAWGAPAPAAPWGAGTAGYWFNTVPIAGTFLPNIEAPESNPQYLKCWLPVELPKAARIAMHRGPMLPPIYQNSSSQEITADQGYRGDFIRHIGSQQSCYCYGSVVGSNPVGVNQGYEQYTHGIEFKDAEAYVVGSGAALLYARWNPQGLRNTPVQDVDTGDWVNTHWYTIEISAAGPVLRANFANTAVSGVKTRGHIYLATRSNAFGGIMLRHVLYATPTAMYVKKDDEYIWVKDGQILESGKYRIMATSLWTIEEV